MSASEDTALMSPPLSVAQEAVWYTTLLAPNSLSYNETISIRKDGPLELTAFRQAFNEFVRRHEAWRTTFDVLNGEAIQIVHPPPHFELPLLDLSHLPFHDAEKHATRLVAEMSRVPYDLRRGPLLRPRFIRFCDQHHRLYLAIHHIAFDGVSLYRVALPELIALYEASIDGRPSPLPPPALNYRDYAAWEQEWITTPKAARRLAYWRDRLSACPSTSFPLDYRRSPNERLRGRVTPLEIDKETVERLRRCGQDIGATLFQMLAASWALLLGRYTGVEDVVTATAADLRQRPEFEKIVGYSITPLVLRLDLSGDISFAELVLRARNELLDGLDHLVPFERIVRELGEHARLDVNPIYQSMVVLEPPIISSDPSWSIHQMESEIGDAVGGARLDLELELDERPEGHIAGRLIYDSTLFEPATVERMAVYFCGLLASAARNPDTPLGDIAPIDEQDREELDKWNATTTKRPARLVHELVAVQARACPDAPALSDSACSLTYGQLDAQAEQSAARLRDAGLGPGDVVAFCAEPSADLIVAILGTLKAGAAYMLLDPMLPPDDLDFLVSEVNVGTVYADPPLAARLSGQSTPLRASTGSFRSEDSDEQIDASGVGSLCCVHCVSENGEWRAVGMHHQAVSNLARAMSADLNIDSEDTVLALRPSLFTAAAFELWMPLCAGAKLVLAPAEVSHNGASVSSVVSKERVSFLHATESHWRELVQTGFRATRGLVALCGGPPSSELAELLLERCRVLFTAFGSAETTVYATLGRVERSLPVTVGAPIANARLHVVDARGEPVPPGAVGTLLVAGEVISGYIQPMQADMTPFVADPCGEGLAFLTGIRARWRLGGRLELVTGEPTFAATQTPATR